MIFVSILFTRIFVPFKSTEEKYIPQLKWNNLLTFLNSSNLTIAYVGSIDPNEPVMMMMNNAAITFGHKINFISLDSSGADKFLAQYNCTRDSFFFFLGSKVWLATAVPGSETSFQFLISAFIQQTITSVQNKEAFNSVLGHFPYALITETNNLEKVFSLRYQCAPYLGPIDIIVASREIINELNITDDTVGLFRLEDRVIDIINISFDAVFNAVKPTFRRLVNFDLFDRSQTIAALIVDDITSDMEDFLFHLALRHPKFIVGWIPPSRHQIVEKSTLLKFDSAHVPSFVAFSAFDRSYFPMESNSLSKKFAKDSWYEECTKYLKNIENGNILRKYHNLENPTILNNSVTHLTGNIYDSYMNDTENDLFVLYYIENDADSQQALTALQEAAGILNQTRIKFAAIEANQNSSPRLFPVMMYTPHYRLFPAKNRSADVPYFHAFNSIEIIRFLKNFASENITIEVPKKDEAEFKKEVSLFVQMMFRMPTKDKEILTPYFKQMWLDLGIEFGSKINENEIPLDGIEYLDDDNVIAEKANETVSDNASSEKNTNEDNKEL